ncbi:Peptide transporter CstA [bioreactor metagenome]|uniref:Peptide transporter CstA n=1 Tax=bioreactor metagenome TaxID=1076179 RepID=A0A644WA11_9ZZZZ
MTTTTMTIIALVIWGFGYLVVSAHLQKKYFIYKPDRMVPAIQFRDDVDFYPAHIVSLFGDHWASIAGGSPLAGGATGPYWGVLPAFLYITIGNIFLGSPHDYATMHLSVRKEGMTIGLLIKDLIGERASKLGVFLGWASIAAFTATFMSSLPALFVSTPTLTIPTLVFTIIGVIMGFMIYKVGLPLMLVSILGIVVELISVWVGLRVPILMSNNFWFVVFVVYPILSACLPAWVLVEPKNFLSFCLIVIGCLALFIGGVVGNLPLQIPLFIANSAKGPVWPMLFLTISCGALTGMHSFWTTGYTSRRIPDEKYVRVVGYAGEVLEGVTAYIALACACVLPLATYLEYIAKGWIFILQNGYSVICGKVFPFVSFDTWKVFGGLLGSIFMITTLESGARNMRIFLLELVGFIRNKPITASYAKWVSASISMLACAALCKSGTWFYIWVLFPCLSGLLACNSFMVVILWLKLVGRPQTYFWYALWITMFVVAIPGSAYLTWTYIVTKTYYLAWIPALAIVFVAIFFHDFWVRLKGMTPEEIAIASAKENE